VLSWIRNHYGFTVDVGPFSKAVTLLEHTSRHGGSVEKPVYKIILFEHARLIESERKSEIFKKYYSLPEAMQIAEREIKSLLARAINSTK
jgi:hypothetical protein